jgi:PAS domain S-box-containing protein
MATVLVVDDHTTNRELVRTLLGYGGHQVIEAHEGAEALTIAHAQHPDLVLTDIIMPGMDGYELARELRAAPDTAHTPIVFYTANYLVDEIRPFAEACGVARILLKSDDPQILINAIDEIVAEEWVAAGPIDTLEAGREHLHAVSAKLFEKSETLVSTEARFRLMADFSPVGIIFGDEHGSANYVNARLTQILGAPAEELLGLGWLRCASDDRHPEILAAIRGGTAQDVEHRYRGQIALPTGPPRWLTVHLQAVRDDDRELSGFIGTVDDVTTVVEADQQRQAAERRLDIEARDQATERLESLGRLAGGVAHDFNNILTVILTFESLVAESLAELITADRLEADTGGAILGDLKRIRSGGERLKGLTAQLQAFGSRRVIKLSALDLNQAVAEHNDLIAPTLGVGVRVVTDLDPALRSVLAEPTNVAQILLNLTVNAGQAMPGGGTITMATRNVDPADDHSHAASHRRNEQQSRSSGPRPGRYARLTVRDTGHGMTPEILQRAIEPFFTTKPQGQGTGFGLATVYGIVNQLGGSLGIESAPGRGTLVTVELPTTDEPVETSAASATPAAGTETILVAEDEDGIREVVARRLSAAGYQVLTAADGSAALRLAEQHSGRIHLLLSDVMMPGMRGDELAARLLEQRPEVKVLFMSGYAGALMNKLGVLVRDVTVLPKPFTTPELLTAVRTMLGVVGPGP